MPQNYQRRRLNSKPRNGPSPYPLAVFEQPEKLAGLASVAAGLMAERQRQRDTDPNDLVPEIKVTRQPRAGKSDRLPLAPSDRAQIIELPEPSLAEVRAGALASPLSAFPGLSPQVSPAKPSFSVHTLDDGQPPEAPIPLADLARIVGMTPVAIAADMREDLIGKSQGGRNYVSNYDAAQWLGSGTPLARLAWNRLIFASVNRVRSR